MRSRKPNRSHLQQFYCNKYRVRVHARENSKLATKVQVQSFFIIHISTTTFHLQYCLQLHSTNESLQSRGAVVNWKTWISERKFVSLWRSFFSRMPYFVFCLQISGFLPFLPKGKEIESEQIKIQKKCTALPPAAAMSRLQSFPPNFSAIQPFSHSAFQPFSQKKTADSL